MKNKNLILAVAIFALISAGATLWLNRDSSLSIMSRPVMEMRGEYAAPSSGETQVSMGASGMMGRNAVADGVDVATSKMIAPAPDYYWPQPIDGDALNIEDRSYTKSATHQVVIKDVPAYIKQMREYVLSIDGRVLNTSIETNDKYSYGYLFVKVPADKFDEATGRATEGVQKVLQENINANDVTGQVVGVAQKLQSLQDQKALKEAELAEAKAKNSSITVTLRIQQQIDALQRQIDDVQKQQENTTNQVEYATLNISAANSERYFSGMLYQPTPWEEIQAAVESLGGSTRVIGKLLIWTAVYSVIWLPIMLIVRWVKRPRTNSATQSS